jgi:heme-degrading monooxygenase HmoA
VTLHLWRLPRAAVPAAVLRMARDRGAVRRTPGLRFAKLLGTGDGRTFTVRDADPLRWCLLATWTSTQAAREFEATSAVARGWGSLAEESWRVDLQSVASRGAWSGRQPFGSPTPVRTEGPVAALTRARLRARSAAGFWRSVPPVSADLHDRPGLRAAFGIGEAPIGLQGTFSLWQSGEAIREFARAPAHAAVVARTEPERWYAEELFARFAVLGSAGTLDGRDPLA